ncbi:MAG: metallopeptidase family protein [Deltaproteobacteria bacterium]|nr:metallopeptidase family protein [Deltaproteobacteria bacterium]
MKSNDRYWDCLDQAMEASHGGRTEEALAWLDEALRAHPEGAEAHNGRGEILWDEGKIDEALHEFERAIQADPKFVTAYLNRVELLVEDHSEFEQAVALCDELLSGRPELPRLDRGTEAEVHYLKAKAVFYLDDLEGALFLVRRALKTSGEIAIYRSFDGQILFELGRFEEAKRSLEAAVALDPEAGHAIYHLAQTLERLGDDDGASQVFARANALDPERYPLPAEIGEPQFRKAAAEALDNLPRSIREYVADVPVLVEDWPSRQLLAEENVSPQILGIYLGVPRTEAEASAQPQDLTRVILFKKNLEKICRDGEDLIEQIQITVRHEIGHHLGLSEEDLERLGLA